MPVDPCTVDWSAIHELVVGYSRLAESEVWLCPTSSCCLGVLPSALLVVVVEQRRAGGQGGRSTPRSCNKCLYRCTCGLHRQHQLHATHERNQQGQRHGQLPLLFHNLVLHMLRIHATEITTQGVDTAACQGVMMTTKATDMSTCCAQDIATCRKSSCWRSSALLGLSLGFFFIRDDSRVFRAGL